jgi:RAP1 GTPase activating protein 1
MIKTEAGWINETGSSKVTSMDLSTSTGMSYSMEMDVTCMDESQKGIESDAWYATYFKSAEHFNFLAVEDSHGPVSISVMRDGDLVRAIVRTEKVQDKLAVPASVLLKGSGSLGKKDKRGLLKSIVPPGWHLKNVREVKETKHIDELAMFETNELQTKFKWGVLYAKHGQTKEDQMFANNETSEHFKEFLSTLGETITLNGWTGYTGGLDTNKNMTGTQSVFTSFHDHQIMFHVAPMLPHDPECPQQLERKRHLGNDVVVIVFMDNDNVSGLSTNDPEAYLPTTIRTHFQHVLAVVQRDPTASTPGKPRYRLHVSRKSDVPPFGPELPSPSLFDKTQLRNVLLSKLINGERAALKAPAFERAISRTRSGFIQYYHQEYTKK